VHFGVSASLIPVFTNRKYTQAFFYGRINLLADYMKTKKNVRTHAYKYRVIFRSRFKKVY
jgi:hypothetical protein